MSKFFRIKLSIVSLFALVPLLGAAVSAQSENPGLWCTSSQEVQIEFDGPVLCDLAIKKEVKVNDGDYADANNDPNAVVANVGDTITWRITVTNNSTAGLEPRGIVQVVDVLPALLEAISVTPSSGTTFTTIDGWSIDVGNDLPATLTFVTKATTATILTNTASLGDYDNCYEGCSEEYTDDNNDNNSDSAVALVSAPPQVLGASTTTPNAVLAATTLADTGTSLYGSILAAVLITGAIGATVATYKLR